jgi:ABC-2 type transport system ATP-binding protein
MIGRLYHLGRRKSQDRARTLLTQFRLEDAANRPAKTYSGGMRRRLDLAGALVADPEVLFLDEPTTGLDPKGRLDMWEVISDLVAGRTTLLLTTQYMEEADRLADDIVVIDHGKVIAQGTADQLKSQIGGERIEVILSDANDVGSARSVLAQLCMGDVQVEEQDRRLTAAVTGGVDVLKQVLQRFGDAKVDVADVGLRRPTLDDVFLSLTGHVAEEAAPADDGSEEKKGRGRDAREKEAVR